MRTVVALTIMILVCAGTVQAFSLFGGSMESVTAKDGVVTLNTAKLAAGEAKHYRYTEGGKTIRFFVVKDAQGVVRTALDACEACWREDKGYKLQSGAMLCVNCGMKFALSRIGFARGGCNPHPIVYKAEGDTLTVSARELLAGAGYFPGNR